MRSNYLNHVQIVTIEKAGFAMTAPVRILALQLRLVQSIIAITTNYDNNHLMIKVLRTKIIAVKTKPKRKVAQMPDEQEKQEVTMPEMDMGEAQAPVPPSEGWHPAKLMDVDTAYSKDDLDLPEPVRRRNFILKFALAEDDMEAPGFRPGNFYVPAPAPAEIDYAKKFKAMTKDEQTQSRADNPEMHAKDGRTKYAQKMDWIKKAAAAFGGKETGKFDKNFFVKQIGGRVMIQLVHEEYQGEIQARTNFMGIKPA